jgi:hypothetical protein
MRRINELLFNLNNLVIILPFNEETLAEVA